MQVWVTGHWDPWPENGGATNSTAVTANVPKCEDGSSVVGKQYSKPVVADCTALSQMLRTSPAASHEQLITRQEKFLRRSGTCQLSIITHPMVRPAQDYASFNDLADGIDSVVESCVCLSIIPPQMCDLLQYGVVLDEKGNEIMLTRGLVCSD